MLYRLSAEINNVAKNNNNNNNKKKDVVETLSTKHAEEKKVTIAPVYEKIWAQLFKANDVVT